VNKKRIYQEINQELIGLGAHRLVDFRGSSEFSVPNDLDQLVHHPVLSKIDEQEFSVPVDFFEKNQSDFLDQTPIYKSRNKLFKITLWSLPLTAAAVLILVFLIPGIIQDDNCSSFDCLLAQTELELSDYEYLYTDVGDLSELVNSDDLFIDITEDEAVEYLLDSDFETEELW